ncbi:MAG TPA: IclR family transcriptional regulator [Planctomycetota bacterium]|nr:IclR family transcriptional regulator [Planctomycetota bacterium]
MKTANALAAAYPVPALEKGLDLLEALSARAEALSLVDLARELGRSPGEIFRMLNCLERRGYIARDDGRYRLTLKLYGLAHAHTPVDALLRAAARPMQALVRAVVESAHLSVLSQGKLVVLSQVESTHRIRLSVEVGGRFPVTRTASGRLLLAHLPPEEREAMLADSGETRDMPASARRRLEAQLAEIRRNEVTVVKSDLTEGILDVAALVGRPSAGVAAALCVPSLRRIGNPRPVATLKKAVLRAARDITRALGLEEAR